MAVDVMTETTIRRPVATVFAFAGDPANAPAWYANIRSVRWRTEAVVAAGAQVEFTAHFLGRELVYTYELTDVVPNERLVMRTAQGPFPMETTYTWGSVGDAQTRMTLRNRGEPAGFSRLLVPLMAPAMRHANRKDLSRLKSLLEASPS